ncbi:ROK family transcriptional regulator [Bacillus sp. BGMRC 2118]|nr:ROK family transcriptional regulator [Bacillus sp. BGMRC 2118]
MTWNQQIVKMNNKRDILDLIRQHSPISRADISVRLGLTKATVSSLVNELSDSFLCYESGPGESSGGRRPVMLLFNKDAGYSIGIDIGVNYILGILTNLNGNIIVEKHEPYQIDNYETTLRKVKELINYLIDSTPISPYGVIGIGIGVPGIVNNEGSILLAPNLDWQNINIKNELEQEYNVPIIIENEANAGAYGEKKYGAGKDYENIIYISAGIGIGAGLILNNLLYRGGHGFSGELGHMIIEHEGKLCRCGSKGCWEVYASEQALLKVAGDRLKQENRITLEALLTKVNENKDIQEIFREIGIYLGIGISNICNTFNPEQIIIGNRLAVAKEWIQPAIHEVLQKRTLKHHLHTLQLNFSDLTIYSTALGSAAHAIDLFITTTINE